MARKKTDTPTTEKVERPKRQKVAVEFGGETYYMNKAQAELMRPKKTSHHNSPMVNPFVNMEAGDNARIGSISLKLFQMKDIDLKDPEQVAERIGEFFKLYTDADLKPPVAGLATALNNHTRQWLWAVANDQPINGQGDRANLPVEVSDCIKKAYKILESQWESFADAGKLNAVWAIFKGKNLYGYKDQSETILTPNVGDSTTLTAEDISKKYLDSGSDSGSDS